MIATPRTSLIAFVAAAALPAAGSDADAGPPEPAGGCTADNPPARRDLEDLLTDDDLADFRQRTGLAGASPEDAEILADPEDSSTCARLQQLVPKDYRTKGERKIWRLTYFRVGDRYVITMDMDIETGERPPVITRQATIVADREFDVVGTLSN